LESLVVDGGEDLSMEIVEVVGRVAVTTCREVIAVVCSAATVINAQFVATQFQKTVCSEKKYLHPV
jgi:uncharacterized protein (DUF697 family)